jgi:hypothetical protein
MNVPDFYSPTIQIVSLIAAVALTGHLFHEVGAYRRWRDERASRALFVAIILVAIGVGSVISAFGFYAPGSTLPIIGLSFVRGALLVGGIVLLLMDWGAK